MERQKTAAALSANMPVSQNLRDTVYSKEKDPGGFTPFSTVLSFLSLKEVRMDVLTCHNTAFLDIQQKGLTAGKFSFAAVAEQCLRIACKLQSASSNCKQGTKCPPWLMRENCALQM